MERIGTVAIVGVGLIGGSVGMTIRARRLAGHVVGIGRDLDRLNHAIRLGAIDSAETEIARGLARADVAVICTPVGRIAEDSIAAALHGPTHMLVTDAGSVKATIVSAVESNSTARARFAGAHPIAGSERSGVEASAADLFEGRPCVVTPTNETPPDRLARAIELWSALGCLTVEMSPEAHDQALARTSHLPHVVASALAGCVPEAWLGLTGGAFRDGTRVAGSDPSLWADIFLANRAPTLDALDEYHHRLGAFRAALVKGDPSAIAAWWIERRSEPTPQGTRR